MNSVIQAHETELGALSVNPDGTLIASASQKGTVIKIFGADGGETLQTLRRGSGNAIINDIQHNHRSRFPKHHCLSILGIPLVNTDTTIVIPSPMMIIMLVVVSVAMSAMMLSMMLLRWW